VGDDARHGVAAAVVVAEDLGEEAPEGRERAEHPVAVLDLMFVEGIPDAGLGQDVCEREALVACEAGAELIQAGHGIGFGAPGWEGREMSLGPASYATYPTLAQGLRFKMRPGRGLKRMIVVLAGSSGMGERNFERRVTTDPAESVGMRPARGPLSRDVHAASWERIHWND
jgi:hypothetical protein